MLGAINKLIAVIVAAVAVVALARAGFFVPAAIIVVIGLVLLLPSPSLWQRLYGGPPRRIDVAVQHRAGGRAGAAEFSLMTPLDDELRRALSDVAEGSGIPGRSLAFGVLGRDTVRVSSPTVGRADAWETFARMGSRVPGVREGAAVAEIEGVVTRWTFRDAAFVDTSSRSAR
ncbi:MAG: hypothetical protein JNJ54_13165 [Myxococcaceae bacterium]|nr:hypothetical protein [Myxococcaceae bacterium]